MEKYHSKTFFRRVRLPDGLVIEAVRICNVYYTAAMVMIEKVEEDLGEIEPDEKEQR